MAWLLLPLAIVPVVAATSALTATEGFVSALTDDRRPTSTALGVPTA